MGAAAAGPASVVKYLIEKGADVNARDDDGTTALMAAEYRQALFDPSERDEIIRILKRIPAQLMQQREPWQLTCQGLSVCLHLIQSGAPPMDQLLSPAAPARSWLPERP